MVTLFPDPSTLGALLRMGRKSSFAFLLVLLALWGPALHRALLGPHWGSECAFRSAPWKKTSFYRCFLQSLAWVAGVLAGLFVNRIPYTFSPSRISKAFLGTHWCPAKVSVPLLCVCLRPSVWMVNSKLMIIAFLGLTAFPLELRCGSSNLSWGVFLQPAQVPESFKTRRKNTRLGEINCPRVEEETSELGVGALLGGYLGIHSLMLNT